MNIYLSFLFGHLGWLAVVTDMHIFIYIFIRKSTQAPSVQPDLANKRKVVKIIFIKKNTNKQTNKQTRKKIHSERKKVEEKKDRV